MLATCPTHRLLGVLFQIIRVEECTLWVSATFFCCLMSWNYMLYRWCIRHCYFGEMSKLWTKNNFPYIKTNRQNSLSRWKVFCTFLPRSLRWTYLWQREENCGILYYEDDDYICSINAVEITMLYNISTEINKVRIELTRFRWEIPMMRSCSRSFCVWCRIMRVHLSVRCKRSYTSPPKQNGQVVYFKRQWLSEPTDCELGVLCRRIQRTAAAAAAAMLCAYRNLPVVCCWMFSSAKKQSELHGRMATKRSEALNVSIRVCSTILSDRIGVPVLYLEWMLVFKCLWYGNSESCVFTSEMKELRGSAEVNFSWSSCYWRIVLSICAWCIDIGNWYFSYSFRGFSQAVFCVKVYMKERKLKEVSDANLDTDYWNKEAYSKYFVAPSLKVSRFRI